MGGEIPSLILRGEQAKAAQKARALLPRAVRGGRLLAGAAGPRHPRAADDQPRAGRDRRARPASPSWPPTTCTTPRGRTRAAQDILHLHRHGQEGVRGQAHEVRVPGVLLQERRGDGAALRRVPEAVAPTPCASPNSATWRSPCPAPCSRIYEVPAGRTPGQLPGGAGPAGPGGALLPRATPRARQRLDYELSVISAMGFTGLLPDRLGLHPLRPRAGHPRGARAGLGRGLPGGLRAEDHRHRPAASTACCSSAS